MNSKIIPGLVFFLLLLIVSFQLFSVFNLFITPILWAAILAIVFYPLYRWVVRLFGGRRGIAALLMTLFVLVITLGPIALFSGTLAHEILDFFGLVSLWIQKGEAVQLLGRIQDSPLGGFFAEAQKKMATLNIEIVPVTVGFLQKLTQTIVNQLQAVARNFVVFVFDYLVILFALFFFLRDGESLAKGVKDFFPLSREHKETIIGRLEETVSAVVRGVGITGLTQGLLAGVAFWILGVPYPLFLGLLTAFLAFLPLGGAVVIWLPSAVYLYLSGHAVKAIILFLWGVLAISMVDNILKPVLIGEKTKIPTLFLFFAILGGLSYYGFIGVFLGPVILTLFLTLIQIYRKEYGS